MLSLKENVMETLKHGKPDAFVNEWEPFPQVWGPMTSYLLPLGPGGGRAINPWGVTLEWGEGEPGAMPIVNDETKVCPDVTRWREYVKIPDIRKAMDEADWTQAKADAEKFRAEGKFPMAWVFTGLFEQCHYLMGFEDTLMNLLLEPEAMHELIAEIAKFKKLQVEILIEKIHPEVIMFHDDWGSKLNLFMQPDVWREFFKDHYKEIYGLMKENGIITMHHADCYCQPIVQDMVDVGIDIWEGVIPTNDIQKIKEMTNYKLTLMGGIDAQLIDRPDATEAEIRAEVARACKDYHEGGCFIPCLPYGGEGSIFPGVNDIIMDEVRNQSKIYFG